MQKPNPKHPILLWALTRQGELNAHFFVDLPEAEKFGRLNVESGAWRTWDAFELPLEVSDSGYTLVSSHGKTKKRGRRRVIPD